MDGSWPLCLVMQHNEQWRAVPWGGMHSQASYWFSIGFKQMVCTVATCYWFLAIGFTKPEAFFPLNIKTGSLIAQSFFYLY